MNKNERLQALRILVQLLQDKRPLSMTMRPELNLTPFTKELCFGVCRQYFRLQLIADQLLDKRPKTSDLWAIILMGLYQLHYLRTPDYAVVQESVALTNQVNKAWAKGLINAVLRRFCREQASLIARLQQQDEFIHGQPQWLVQCLQRDWPQHWQQIVQANDEHPPLSLRVNRLHGNRDDYLQRLQKAGIAAQALAFSEVGIKLLAPCDVKQLPGFAEGDVSVQDEAAQLAVSLLDLYPGLRVLDACCAPGGKTCHMLETEPQLDCHAVDIDSGRLQRVQDNLSRCGLQAKLIQGDGLNPKAWWDGQLYDRILLDAPCSATGVIRRHPDIKLLRNQAEIDAVIRTQQALLNQLWPLLKPKGLLVYATCSIMPQENEQQIAAFLIEHQDCHLVNQPKPWGYDRGTGWQILPSTNQDGFFYSVLQKE